VAHPSDDGQEAALRMRSSFTPAFINIKFFDSLSRVQDLPYAARVLSSEGARHEAF